MKKLKKWLTVAATLVAFLAWCFHSIPALVIGVSLLLGVWIVERDFDVAKSMRTWSFVNHRGVRNM